MRFSEKLKQRYIEEIRQADWDKIKEDCKEYAEKDAFGDLIGRCYVGSICGTFPSGKVWTFWTTNQNKKDMVRDTAFAEALDHVAEENDCGWECDGDDIFIYTCFDS